MKPLDEKLIDSLEGKYRLIVTIEENVLKGGYGESVLEYVNSCNMDIKVYNAALKDEFIEHGSVDYLRDKYGLNADVISSNIINMIK